MLQGRRRMSLRSVKLRTREARMQKHVCMRIILFLLCSILYFFLSMHRNGHFFCLKRRKKIPFLGYTRKMRKLFTNFFRQSEDSTEAILHQLQVFTMKLAAHIFKFSQRTYLLVRQTATLDRAKNDKKSTMLTQITKLFLHMQELLIKLYN